uniref:Uncharacterized protein LOC111132501 n=1 Tax=Crassostrea virginica TaxID=6565 RepID=A0A8B8E799_CRAVI|nr:uncharacterized protein LOC111132501 [Crassostrea virginica]
MANKEEEFPLGTPQEHALICEKHDLRPIDVTCEDCEEFICSKCAKEDHKDHNWDTISTAATLRTRGLLKAMKKIEEKDIQQIDEHIQKASQQMEENKKRYESEVSKLQKHYDAMVKTLDKIKKKHEKILRDSLERKNADMSKAKSSLEEKKKKVLQCVKSMKEEGSTMTDIILIKTHRKLTKLISTKVDNKQKSDFLLRHEGGDINEAMLESMMGQTFDAEQITVTETDSFQGGEEPIYVLEATNESSSLLTNTKFQNVVQFSISDKKEKQFSVDVGGVCVTDNNDVYVSDWKNRSISRLSPSDSVSPVFSTDPLQPWGICQTMDGGLLVTLGDNVSDYFQPNSDSRRLMRHVTLTGDVIREYEYQEDGQTRLFTAPVRVTQNDVACDSYHNIIVGEAQKSSVHLLSSDGEFMRYLLTENQVNHPYSMSLKKSTLWISDCKGRVKVFQYNPYTKVKTAEGAELCEEEEEEEEEEGKGGGVYSSRSLPDNNKRAPLKKESDTPL